MVGLVRCFGWPVYLLAWCGSVFGLFVCWFATLLIFEFWVVCMLVVVCLVWLLLVLGWSAFVLTWFYWWFSRLLFDWGECCLG